MQNQSKPITPIPAVLKIMPYLVLALKHDKSQCSGLTHKLQLRIIVLMLGYLMFFEKSF
jgi:hypothetical protein